MNKLQAGFARLDNTPEIGAPIHGYTFVRYSEGVLDPLEINTLALSDGENIALVISYDSLGVGNPTVMNWRKRISEETGVALDSIYVTATHSHTAPGAPTSTQNEYADRYFEAMPGRLVESALLAIKDMKPAVMGWGIGEAPNVSFCRRFRMKDGSCRTNPGVNNPEIDCPISEVDKRVSILRFDREGADTILLVNFANHPDVIGGNMFSADWPGFARRTTEKVLDGVVCMVVNGAQGDINHVNVHPTGGYGNDLVRDFDDVDRGYGHSRYIGRVVTAGVLQAFDKVKYVDVDEVGGTVKTILIPSNKPAPEELPEAKRIWQMHNEGRDAELPYEGMMLTTVVSEARRRVFLADAPDNFEMDLIALKIGKVALIGIPGEPFSEIGNQLKRAQGWELVIPTCLTNGYQGYFPTFDAYSEGGYEARSSNFRAGVAERIIAGGTELLDGIIND